MRNRATDTGDGGLPDTVEGPLNDKMADSGKLFGDLYKILRYTGGETKMVPEVNDDGVAVCRDSTSTSDPKEFIECTADNAKQYLVPGPTAIGGEPILSDGYGWYVKELTDGKYVPAQSSLISQCVQPVADFDKWGNIGRPGNTLPLVMTYECRLGQNGVRCWGTRWHTNCQIRWNIGHGQCNQ